MRTGPAATARPSGATWDARARTGRCPWRRSTSSVTPIGTSRRRSPRAARWFTALLPNVLFFATGPELVARVLEVTAELTAAVPSFALGFRPEPSVWEVIAAA